MNIREQFEEIWPVPDEIEWSPSRCAYWTGQHGFMLFAAEMNLRLDTFTRCQETTAIHLSLIDELVQEIESCHADLRKESWYVPRQSGLLDCAKQIMEQKK